MTDIEDFINSQITSSARHVKEGKLSKAIENEKLINKYLPYTSPAYQEDVSIYTYELLKYVRNMRFGYKFEMYCKELEERI